MWCSTSQKKIVSILALGRRGSSGAARMVSRFGGALSRAISMVGRSYYAPAKDRNVHKHQNNQPHIKPRENIFGCAGLHCALPAPTPNNKVGGPFCNEEQNDRLNPPTQSSRSERSFCSSLQKGPPTLLFGV